LFKHYYLPHLSVKIPKLDRSYLYLILVLCVFGIFLSCQNNATEEKVDIKGRWKVERALRDGAPTETLGDAYFEFVDRENLKTNINRKDDSFKYTFDQKVITQTGPFNAEYFVDYLVSDTMVLSTIIRNYDFKFLLIREDLNSDTITTNPEI
jgi:hypothetical protein